MWLTLVVFVSNSINSVKKKKKPPPRTGDMTFALSMVWAMAPPVFSWSNIPSELLFLVFQNLTDWDDIARCSAICLAWRYAIKTDFQKLKLISPPFLLLSNYNEYNSHKHSILHLLQTPDR